LPRSAPPVGHTQSCSGKKDFQIAVPPSDVSDAWGDRFAFVSDSEPSAAYFAAHGANKTNRVVTATPSTGNTHPIAA
jgi:hypothetical protein